MLEDHLENEMAEREFSLTLKFKEIGFVSSAF